MEIERQKKAAHPEVVSLFTKPQTSAAFNVNVRSRFGTLPVATNIVAENSA